MLSFACVLFFFFLLVCRCVYGTAVSARSPLRPDCITDYISCCRRLAGSLPHRILHFVDTGDKLAVDGNQIPPNGKLAAVCYMLNTADVLELLKSNFETN